MARDPAAVIPHGEDRSISWSIALRARLAQPVDGAALIERLHKLTAANPQLGAAKVAPESLSRLAAEPYRVGDPLLRVAADQNELLIAGHHSVLDGLGLLAVLGALLDSPVTSSATGLGERPSHRTPLTPLTAAARLAEALLAPPSRLARDSAKSEGETLVEQDIPATSITAADLLASATAAVADFNRARRTPAHRVIAAVGASVQGGAHPTIGDHSRFLRVRCAGDVAELRAQLAAQPAQQSPSGTLARVASRLLAGRLGSTFLLSNLGRITAPETVRTLAFYPVAPGETGVAFGVTTVGGTTTLTLRARAAHLAAAPAAELLAGVLDRLTSPKPNNAEKAAH